MEEGGFQVFFLGNQTVHGTYGGEEGRTLNPNFDLIYAVFRLDVCPQSPMILLCRTITPTLRDPDGYGARNGECFNQFLGRGLIQGARGVIETDDPDIVRLVVRMVLTFPANP